MAHATRSPAPRKQATQIMTSLSSIVEMAFEKELECLVGNLRKAPSTVYMLSAMFKDDTLKALLVNLSTGEDMQLEGSAASVQTRKIRAGMKKFKHVEKWEAFITEALHFLAPDKFPEDGHEAEYNAFAMLKLALNVDDDSDFPAVYCLGCGTVERCLEGFKTRYVEMGERFKHFSVDDIKHDRVGYYRNVPENPLHVANIFDDKIVDVGFGESVEILNAYDVDTEVAVKMAGGKKCKVELRAQIDENGTVIPSFSEKWTLPGFTKNSEDASASGAANSSPAKAKVMAAGTSPKGSPNSASISETLRKRLQAKKSQGKSASSSADA
eukprot:TRINITY_DN43592_c0_g1_i1.p1 TRINITY_DN43592_c0_g1~~TRINITY_DN43592_c0_g1_i1.p1  ORF type:complete len:326 (+),score=85.33 TRINITY_DN43592_c0_g1_i1:130-1107(+)